MRVSFDSLDRRVYIYGVAGRGQPTASHICAEKKK